MSTGSTIYIPHSSDKTQGVGKGKIAQAKFTFHIVQIKLVSTLGFPIFVAIIYIPHSSDKTVRGLSCTKRRYRIYIPHSSDKTIFSNPSPGDVPTFTFHIVQIKRRFR